MWPISAGRGCTHGTRSSAGDIRATCQRVERLDERRKLGIDVCPHHGQSDWFRGFWSRREQTDGLRGRGPQDSGLDEGAPYRGMVPWERCCDDEGNVTSFSSYGDRGSAFGWEVDHVVPRAWDGPSRLGNERPLHWRTNARRPVSQLAMIVALGQQSLAQRPPMSGASAYPSPPWCR